MRELWPAWPPVATRSTSAVSQPLGRAVDGRRQPRRAAAHDHEVVELARRRPADADAPGDLRDVRRAQRLAVLQQHQRQALGLVAVQAGGRQQRAGARGVALDVDVAERHEVAGQEVAQLVRGAREAVADHAQPVLGRRPRRVPRREQVVEGRVQLLLGRVPRLHEVAVEADAVDGVDRGLRVGVGRQQHAPRVRRQRARLGHELDAGHLRHALVGQQQRDGLAPAGDLLQRVQRLLPRGRRQHAVAGAVVTAQVAVDRAGDRGVVVHREQDGTRGGAFLGGGHGGPQATSGRRRATGPPAPRATPRAGGPPPRPPR